MNIDLSKLSADQVYGAMIQNVVPRPVAWVLSLNANGRYNLAPFSDFNGVCSEYVSFGQVLDIPRPP